MITITEHNKGGFVVSFGLVQFRCRTLKSALRSKRDLRKALLILGLL